ncbi:DMSO/selenate family reductase complex A subunit [Ferrimonas aestuarii]|uniref:Dimethyl sulfoxide reductase subunit A n=1 Tax=Ferrimonas aestuarii TaxID=2569539 RepID=A0A4U1BPR4_9GAMM|nr:DMSO/selenate family reductase complex A subunit [Ferrimonas aestuarii]TKB56593.1 dimethyl sulfoxide reductase subunit A [Ferrimonas aestuarii]
MQRRDFLKLSAAASAVSCVTACGSKDSQTAVPEVPGPADEQISYNACLVNCGSNCPVKVITSDDTIVRVEGDYHGEDQYGSHQIRACLRGRSLKQRTYAADRLKSPMKRKAGAKRGEAIFEEISWEQAFEEIAAKVTELRDQYGPRSIFQHYGSGAYYGFHSSSCIRRALRLSGGHLNYYGNYSWAQINAATPAIIGSSTQSGSYLSELRNSDLFVGFGFNPFEIRMSGSGEQYDMLNALQDNGNLDVVLVDPRYTDTALGKEDQWLPIRPGTDGALAEAIAYQMISTGWVDANSIDFINKYAIGYDRASLEQAKLDNPDYAEHIDVEENFKDYILREGKFAGETVHTPAWAATVCGIPEQAIIELANKIMNANAPYISIGAGTNRHACGEQTVRSLYMLPILTGKIGQSGVNSGALPKNYGRGTGGMSSGSNPEKASISFFTWAEAIENGENMTYETHGVSGLEAGEKLGTNIKAVFNVSGNALINQHADINHTKAILEDDTKCELIVVCDCWMTPSAKFADYILPDTTWLETDDMAGDSYASGQLGYVTFTKSAITPLYNCKNMYEIGLGLAKAFGVEGEFSEGRTEQQWLDHMYEVTRSYNPDWNLPATYAEAQKVGVYRTFAPTTYVAMKDFVDDAAANPVNTPSGKIEIYSLAWAKKAAETTPLSDMPYDQITALPKYTVAWQGYEDADTKDDYPLQVVGYHTKGRTHSSYHNVAWLREAVEDCVWVNPADAGNFENGQMVKVTSPQGTIEVRIRITPRVIPGVVAMAQGAWYQKGANGVDVGGCSNTLTKYHPTPVSKGNPQHTIRVKLSA